MKKIFGYFAAFVLAAGMIGCSDDDADISGAVEGAQVYFSHNAVTSYTIAAGDSSVAVEVMRGATEETIEVPVLATIDSEYASLFNVSDYVVFEAGEAKTAIEITFDRSKLADGASYAIALQIDDESMTTPYGSNTLNVTLSVPEPYVLLGTGLFREDCVTSLFNVEVKEYACEIYENTNNPGYIYLKNVYTSLYPYNDPGDYVTEDKYLEVYIGNPEKVLIPKQGLGMDWNPVEYGEFILGTAQYGTLKDGVITFPQNGLLVAMALYNNGEWIDYGNKNGMFRICLPGAVLTDYSLDAAYDGFRVAADNVSAYPVVRVACGTDVAKVKYVFVENDLSKNFAAVAAGIADGSIEAAEAEATGGELELVCQEELEAGVYTAVIVPFDAEGAASEADAVAVSFYFPGLGAAEVPECDIAVGVYPFSALFPSYSSVYPDSSTFLWVAEGSEIKALKSLVAPTATIQSMLSYGYSAEELVLENGDLDSQVEDINADGICFAFYTGCPAATSFTVILYAENIYGKSAVVSASGSTAAEAAAKAAAKLSTKNNLSKLPTFSKSKLHYIYR